MVRKLRRREERHGLVLANGGVLTYQHVVCLSSDSRKDGKGYPDENPLAPTTSDISVPEIDDNPKGAAIIEVCNLFHLRSQFLSKLDIHR